MEKCPHTMRAKDRDGKTYCCDCGKLMPTRKEKWEKRSKSPVTK